MAYICSVDLSTEQHRHGTPLVPQQAGNRSGLKEQPDLNAAAAAAGVEGS